MIVMVYTVFEGRLTIYDIDKKSIISKTNTFITGFRDFRTSPSGKQLLIRTYDGKFNLQLIPDVNNLNKQILVGSDISGNLVEYDYCWQTEDVFESYLGVFDIEKWQNTNQSKIKFPWNGNTNLQYYLKVTDLCQSEKHNAQGREITVFNRNNYNERKILVRTLCQAQAISYSGKYIAYLGDNYQLKLMTISVDTSIKENIFCIEIPNYETHPDKTIEVLQNLMNANQLVYGFVVRPKIHPITNKPIEPTTETETDEKDYLAKVQFTKLEGNILYVKLLQSLHNEYSIKEGDYIRGAWSDANNNDFENLNFNDHLFPIRNVFSWVTKIRTNCTPKFTDRNINRSNKNLLESKKSEMSNQNISNEEIITTVKAYSKEDIWLRRNPVLDTPSNYRWVDTKNNFYIDSFNTYISHKENYENNNMLETYYYNSIVEILSKEFEFRDITSSTTFNSFKKIRLDIFLSNQYFKVTSSLSSNPHLGLFSDLLINILENRKIIFRKELKNISTNDGLFIDNNKNYVEIATDFRFGKLQKEIQKFFKDYRK